MDEQLLTVQQVAEMLQVPTTWVYKHTKEGAPHRLPHFKTGKYVRFRREDIRAFLEGLRRV